MRAAASSTCPRRASASTSQNEHGRKAPSVVVRVSHQHSEQEACVEIPLSGRADVAPELVRPAALLDEGTYRLGLSPPCLGAAPRYAARVRERDRAHERHPAHHLRLRVVPRLASDLPYPRVGLAPYPADEVGGPGEAPRGVPIELPARVAVQRRRREQVAEDVELELISGLVADPHGRRVPVPLER